MDITATEAKIKEILESKEFIDNLYDGLDEANRDTLGQFYTPADICIKMLKKFNWDSLAGHTILDPCCGSGNLLIAAIIAGADIDNIYGNEYDLAAVTLCINRINAAIDRLNQDNFLGISDRKHIKSWQIHRGNALHEFALTYFAEDYYDFYKPDDKLTGGGKNTNKKANIDKEEYDPYTSHDFQEKHPDDYIKILEIRKQRNEQKDTDSQDFNGLDWLLN